MTLSIEIMQELKDRGLSRRRCLELASEIIKETKLRGQELVNPELTSQYLMCELKDRTNESFFVMYLDTRHRVIDTEHLFQGSIDGASVYPRVIAEQALYKSAAAVILAHNHPSGVAEPSMADKHITRRIKDALLLLEIRVLDHFVIGDGKPVSMATRGML